MHQPLLTVLEQHANTTHHHVTPTSASGFAEKDPVACEVTPEPHHRTNTVLSRDATKDHCHHFQLLYEVATPTSLLARLRSSSKAVYLTHVIVLLRIFDHTVNSTQADQQEKHRAGTSGWHGCHGETWRNDMSFAATQYDLTVLTCKQMRLRRVYETQHGNSELETHQEPASSLAPASYISVGGRWFGKLGDMGFSSQLRT